MESKPGRNLRIGQSGDRLRAEAVRLETDAAVFTDDRGEILSEAAGMWRRAGDPERALRLCGTVLAHDSGDGPHFARLRRMEVFADLHRWADLDGELHALRAAPVAPRPAHFIAELLESLGRHRDAAEFFERACAPLLADLAQLQPEDVARYLLYFDSAEGRARTRAQSGIAPDELDAIIDQSHEPDTAPLSGVDAEIAQPTSGPPLAAFIARCDYRLPDAERLLLPADLGFADADRYFGLLETEWRRFARGIPGGRIRLVRVPVGAYPEFSRDHKEPPESGAARSAYLSACSSSGGTGDWPPERNAVCWCGSQRKYKKCCATANHPGR